MSVISSVSEVLSAMVVVNPEVVPLVLHRFYAILQMQDAHSTLPGGVQQSSQSPWLAATR